MAKRLKRAKSEIKFLFFISQTIDWEFFSIVLDVVFTKKKSIYVNFRKTYVLGEKQIILIVLRIKDIGINQI